MSDNVKKAEDIAKAEQAKIDAGKAEAKKEADKGKKEVESKGAAAASTAEKPKTEDEKKKETLVKAEAQAKADAKLLETADDKLDEAGKKAKADLKARTDKKPEQGNLDKRFGELSGKIKDLEKDKESNKGEIDTLRTQLEQVEKDKVELEKRLNATPADVEKEQLKKAETDRLAKYQGEDAEKPREDRREMTKEDWNDWALEDMEAAQTWMTRREMRRSQERNKDQANTSAEKKVRALLIKQDASHKRNLAKHPELDTATREKDLAGQGKSPEEIVKTISADNEKYRICREIVNEDPKKYLLQENGPELIVAEMEKRLKPEKRESITEREVREAAIREEAAEAERQRQKDIDEGAGSTRPGERKAKTDDAPENNSELAAIEARAIKRAGLDPEKIKARKEYRKKHGQG